MASCDSSLITYLKALPYRFASHRQSFCIIFRCMRKARLQVHSDSQTIKSLVEHSRLTIPGRGDRFGKLVATGILGYVVSGGLNRLMIECACDCGSKGFTYAQYLRSGKAKSCGCQAAETMRFSPGTRVIDSPLYSVWASMKQRCFDPKCVSYRYYGARGITICNEWRTDFRRFERWALENGFQPGKTIDRRNNNKNYTPCNCRWTDSKTQANNTRRNVLVRAFGETKTIAQWADDPRCRCPPTTLYSRLSTGASPENAITRPTLTEISAFGETKPLLEWAADPRCKVSYKVLWQRLNMNTSFTPELAISAPVRNVGRQRSNHYGLHSERQKERLFRNKQDG